MSDKERPVLQRLPPDYEELAERLAGGVRAERKPAPLKPKIVALPPRASDQPQSKKP
jgi:hypothetical protein